MRVYKSESIKGQNKIKVEFSQRELNELENVEGCIEEIESEVENITFKNKKQTDRISSVLWREIPQPVCSSHKAEERETYDDVLLALEEFTRFFENIKREVENGEPLSDVFIEELISRKIDKSINTHDKYHMIQEEYK